MGKKLTPCGQLNLIKKKIDKAATIAASSEADHLVEQELRHFADGLGGMICGARTLLSARQRNALKEVRRQTLTRFFENRLAGIRHKVESDQRFNRFPEIRDLLLHRLSEQGFGQPAAPTQQVMALSEA